MSKSVCSLKERLSLALLPVGGWGDVQTNSTWYTLAFFIGQMIFTNELQSKDAMTS